MQYPACIEIVPLSGRPDAVVRVPGSKSITNRALVLASLCEPGGECELRGALKSEDTEIMLKALQILGFDIHADWTTQVIYVRRGLGASAIPNRDGDLFVGNSGTSMRFLTAMVAIGRGSYRLDGVSRMRERPIEDLLAPLRQLGVKAYSERGDGCPPVIVESQGLQGGSVQLKGDISSQYLSGLLMAAPLAQNAVSIDIVGPLVSVPYVEMTLQMMWQFGVDVEYDDDFRHFHVPTYGHYQSRPLDIEPDSSAASYFFGAAAIMGGTVTVPHIDKKSLQGDIRFVDVLEEMGCTVSGKSNGITVSGGPLHGIDVDMNDISDTVMTLAAVACFADGTTTIRNVPHIRHKETDRLSALANELRRVGAKVEEFADGLTITPGPLHGAEIETYNDHRMAMSLAVVGLRVPGIIIKNPACVAKTYPHFFDDLEKLR